MSKLFCIVVATLLRRIPPIAEGEKFLVWDPSWDSPAVRKRMKKDKKTHYGEWGDIRQFFSGDRLPFYDERHCPKCRRRFWWEDYGEQSKPSVIVATSRRRKPIRTVKTVLANKMYCNKCGFGFLIPASVRIDIAQAVAAGWKFRIVWPKQPTSARKKGERI